MKFSIQLFMSLYSQNWNWTFFPLTFRHFSRSAWWKKTPQLLFFFSWVALKLFRKNSYRAEVGSRWAGLNGLSADWLGDHMMAQPLLPRWEPPCSKRPRLNHYSSTQHSKINFYPHSQPWGLPLFECGHSLLLKIITHFIYSWSPAHGQYLFSLTSTKC